MENLKSVSDIVGGYGESEEERFEGDFIKMRDIEGLLVILKGVKGPFEPNENSRYPKPYYLIGLLVDGRDAIISVSSQSVINTLKKLMEDETAFPCRGVFSKKLSKNGNYYWNLT